MKLAAVEPEFVEFIPADLAEGKLYVSMLYATTVHLCACGCGNRVVLPLSPAEWQLHFDGVSLSLTPSIGNWEYPCRSHYWIKANKIRWAAPWTNDQIAAGRRRDTEAINAYIADRETTRKAAEEPARPAIPRARPDLGQAPGLAETQLTSTISALILSARTIDSSKLW